MRLKIVLLSASFLLLTNIALAKEPDWLKKLKSIEPLFSTREDVIKVFGQNLDNEKDYLEYYELDGGRMSVQYSTGRCIRKVEDGAEKIYGWNVPEWTVIDMNFTLKRRVNPKKLNLKYSDFRSYEVNDVPGAMVYENDGLGFDFSVYKGKISDITFRPSNKYDYLYCK